MNMGFVHERYDSSMEIQEGGPAQLLHHIPLAFALLVPKHIYMNAS